MSRRSLRAPGPLTRAEAKNFVAQADRSRIPSLLSIEDREFALGHMLDTLARPVDSIPSHERLALLALLDEDIPAEKRWAALGLAADVAADLDLADDLEEVAA